MKETERRAANFEERFGEGATELDALIAIHPGELERIVKGEVMRYFDETLTARFEREVSVTVGQLEAVNHEVIGRHAPAINSLRERYAGVNDEAESLFDQISEELKDRKDDISLPYVDGDPVEEDDGALYDSTRDYVTQVDRYRSHQGKPAGANPPRKKRAP